MKKALGYSVSSSFLALQIVSIVAYYINPPIAIRDSITFCLTVLINIMLVGAVKYFKLSDIIVEEKTKTAKIK
jgi:hypothetical protein